MTLKHADDDGDLSIFAGGSEILFVCPHGHHWIIAATQTSHEDRLAAETDSGSIAERFGREAADLLTGA